MIQKRDKIHLSFYSKTWEKNSILEIKINNKVYIYKNIKNIDNPTYIDDIWFDLSIKIEKETKFIEIFCRD